MLITGRFTGRGPIAFASKPERLAFLRRPKSKDGGAMSDEIEVLRQAAETVSRDMRLKRLLARKLLAAGRYGEAEIEYRKVLGSGQGAAVDQAELAQVFMSQGKNAQAGVLLEEALRRPDCPARAWTLQARLLCGKGDLPRARELYRKAVAGDPALADRSLERDLRLDRAPAVAGPAREEEAPPAGEVEKPGLDFSGVGGMNSLKEELRRKIIYPLTHRDLYAAYGKKAGGGILLYGPPGCGKTYFCRAAAGEAGLSFISVGLHDILDMWLGESEKNLHKIFETARRGAPCVLVFDEVDALGASRSEVRQGAGRTAVNQFLSEMDGMASKNTGVLVLGTTNAPWDVDPAFRRPGRFGEVIFVPPPDAPARAEIFQVHLKGKPREEPDFPGLAASTEGYSGADIRAVCERAIELKVEASLQEGIILPVTNRDLAAAVKEIKPSTAEWLAAARSYALYSNAGGRFDEVLRHLGLRSAD